MADDNIMCNICHDLPTNPILTACKHLYCQSCINMTTKETCPLCRQNPQPILPATKNILDTVFRIRESRSKLCQLCDNTKKQGSDYCTLHTCNFCNDAKTWGSDYCVEHRCCITDCNNQRGQDTETCTEHTCKESGCSDEAEMGYCMKHGCEFSTCPERTLNDYCDDHSCISVGCQGPKLDGDYCWFHECDTRNCTLPSVGGGHCREHKCKVEACLEDNVPRNIYCKRHKCLDRGCMTSKTRPGAYCESHACGMVGCTTGKRKPGENYCQYHSTMEYVPKLRDCRVTNCLAPIAGSGRHFCLSHSCHWGSCRGLVTRASSYCDEHACLKQGCVASRCPVRDGYCSTHTCYFCHKETSGLDSRYCVEHICQASNCPVENQVWF